MNKNHHGLKAQSFIALLISLATAFSVFLVSDFCFYAINDAFIDTIAYVNKKSDKYLDSFQEFISDNKISATDYKRISEWRKSKSKIVTIMYIYRGDTVLYDSLLASRADLSAEDGATESPDNISTSSDNKYIESELFRKREIEFSDGSASVSLYGYFDKWIYDIFFVAEIIISAAAFYAVFIILIRRKINYIITLDDQIKILETGDLNFDVTVKGNDELSSLAESLNQMRLSLAENIRKETEAVSANYNLVVSVSHDLRTPLTSLALYLDFIKNGKYKDENELRSYIEKCRKKVSQIRQMTDRLFDRFYLKEADNLTSLETAKVKDVMEELLSNTVSYLTDNGFEVSANINFPDKKIAFFSDYIDRIADNVSSNILKYADKADPVFVSVSEKGSYLQIVFSNKVKNPAVIPDGTHVGITNIRYMIEKMKGMCETENDGTDFRITLLFRLSTDGYSSYR